MYIKPFVNQYRNHDFALISETINRYYPVGQSKRPASNSPSEWPGFEKIGKLVSAEFLDKKAYRANWEKLVSNLEKALQKPVYAYPDLSGSGFIGEVVISEDKQSDFIRKKSLHFYVSILGPFLSIHGVDSSVALLPIKSISGRSDMGNFAATHVITVSPIFEYTEAFGSLEEELRSYFPGHLFVPYSIGMSTIKYISIADQLRNEQTRYMRGSSDVQQFMNA